MARNISIGRQSYEKIIKSENFYIDKTLLIKDWWENDDDVTLITRPRRFGKTLNMDMLNCFFSNEYEGRSDLFENRNIWKYDEFRKLQGTYPVIFLSFAGMKSDNFAEAFEEINIVICRAYEKIKKEVENDFITDIDREFVAQMNMKMSKMTAALSINFLCKLMSQKYNKKPIILLDEYDTPLQEAYINGYWDEMSSFIRLLFNNTFKTNEYFSRAIMTGITRVSKESMFSDLNNLELCTMSYEKYQQYFGFTEEEVFESMDEFGYKNKDEVKQWYDGFNIGSLKDIYNPWSIINFLDKGMLKPYWSNTSSNGLAGKLLREGSKNLKIDFEELLRGKTIIKEIDEDIVFSQLDNNRDVYAIIKLTPLGEKR